MGTRIDARIPVIFGIDPEPHDTVLAVTGDIAHPAGCGCCVSRGLHAVALDRLFLQRVRGEIPWFSRVVVACDDDGLRAALQTDPVLSARFRLG